MAEGVPTTFREYVLVDQDWRAIEVTAATETSRGTIPWEGGDLLCLECWA